MILHEFRGLAFSILAASAGISTARAESAFDRMPPNSVYGAVRATFNNPDGSELKFLCSGFSDETSFLGIAQIYQKQTTYPNNARHLFKRDGQKLSFVSVRSFMERVDLPSTPGKPRWQSWNRLDGGPTFYPTSLQMASISVFDDRGMGSGAICDLNQCKADTPDLTYAQARKISDDIGRQCLAIFQQQSDKAEIPGDPVTYRMVSVPISYRSPRPPQP